MSKLEIDLNAPKSVLLAAIGMLTELHGGVIPLHPSQTLEGAVAERDDATLEEASDALEQNEAEEELGNEHADPEHATASPDAAGAGAAQTGEVDEKGVVKDGKFCSTAKVPFYATGKRQGQWKKRQGVHDDAYDAWYAEQLAAVDDTADATAEEPDGEVNTASAFQQKTVETVDNPPSEVPTSGPEFVVWLSEQQANGDITQAEIGAAYAEAGVSVADLFPPTPAATTADAVARVHAQLTGAV